MDLFILVVNGCGMGFAVLFSLILGKLVSAVGWGFLYCVVLSNAVVGYHVAAGFPPQVELGAEEKGEVHCLGSFRSKILSKTRLSNPLGKVVVLT